VTDLDDAAISHLYALPLYRERYLLVTPEGGPLAARETVSWQEAAEQPLCLLTPDMQGRRIIDAQFSEAGLVVRPTVESNSLIALCSHLRGGFSSVLPHTILYLMGALEGTRAIPLESRSAGQPVGLVAPRRDPRPPAAEALFAALAAAPIDGRVDALWPRAARLSSAD
jgi:DNA-binding transcriptional LysR family regulator